MEIKWVGRREVEINNGNPTLEMDFCDSTLKRHGNVLEDVWGFVVDKDSRRSKEEEVWGRQRKNRCGT
ncbi:hypothetical protein E2C01_043633 [Portunus trituberculatus]|uniref:Uncharacterized protein n=1 Tax=Portunus trituberculatus TaxID=210409 RepID=A0A5B7FX84_PORTR|nr:hypothetical protein [Portunus trituberculatus]